MEGGGDSVLHPVRRNRQLADLKGLSHLAQVAGELYIADNPALRSFDGLSNLISVGTRLGIGGSASAGSDKKEEKAV